MAKAMSLIMLLAATMQGEVGVLDSDEAALAVFEVAWNRKVAFGMDIRSALIEGFYGWRGIAEGDIKPRYVRLASRALSGGHRWTHPALYMLSWDDLVALGGVNHPPMRHWRNGRWAVYLYERWPR